MYFVPDCGGDSAAFSVNKMPASFKMPANSGPNSGGGDGKGYWSWGFYAP